MPALVLTSSTFLIVAQECGATVFTQRAWEVPRRCQEWMPAQEGVGSRENLSSLFEERSDYLGRLMLPARPCRAVDARWHCAQVALAE